MSELIERETIIGVIKELPNANPSYSHDCDVVDRADLIYIVERLEAVQPKKGKWIFCHPLQADDPGAYKCSVCGYGDWGLDPKIDKFCFNCGADMREVNNK